MAYSSTLYDNGQKLALRGDKATCGNCKGLHDIYGTGTGMSEDSRPVVLDGDEVQCPCGKNRVIVGSDPGVFVETSNHSPVPGNTTTTIDAIGLTANSSRYDERFTLTDGDHRVLAKTYYTLRLPSGDLLHGTTDRSGQTERCPTNGAQKLTVYLGHRESV